MMRRWILYCTTLGVLLSAAPHGASAGTAGRRNTAIAATAVAVGAWSNHTGKAGRRNTAIAATAGAAYAWKRYNDQKKNERRARTVRVVRVARPVYVTRASRPTYVAVASDAPPCPCGHGCGIKEYKTKPSGEVKIKYLCGAEWERKASGETKFKR
jgi:hypothetical protein